MKRAFLAALAVGASVGVAGLTMHGCVGDGQGDRPRQGPVLDDTTRAFLSKARAAHHSADLRESADLAGAIRDIESITAGPRPPATPETSEVLADAFARLAELRTRNGAYADALRDVENGLELAREDTHFRGHLFEVRGLVFEQQYEALLAEGRGDEAGSVKEKALDAFEAAIDVQERVIQKALGVAP